MARQLAGYSDDRPEATADGVAGDATLRAVLVSTGIAIVVLVPSLWLLFRLVLRGTLGQDYEPLDQRFRPLDAGAPGDRSADDGASR